MENKKKQKQKRRKPVMLNCWLTVIQKAQMQHLARKKGYPVSTMIRMLVEKLIAAAEEDGIFDDFNLEQEISIMKLRSWSEREDFDIEEESKDEEK